MKLQGIRVLDLSLFLPGPLLTQAMADHGAEVIKLEPAGAGEPNREIGPKRDGLSVYYANTHRNKRSLQLNLKTPEGRAVALALAARADVLIEGFRPGVAARLGLGYEAVHASNPGIVYCSMSAWGQDGPYAQKPAHDLATEAMAGVLSINLGTDGRPAIPGVAAADMLSSSMALAAVLMALLRRKDTGRGDYIDSAMADCLLAAAANNILTVFADGSPPDPSRERALGGYALYQIYDTADGRQVVFGGSELHFAEAVLRKLGRPDLIEAAKPPPGPTQEPVKAFLRETLRTRTQAEWVEFFADVDCAFAPVKTLREAADDPQLRHRRMVVEDRRGWEHLGTPLKFREEPGELRFEFARLGEHTEEILAELGYDEAARTGLKAAGAY
jgi:crotonobetainyl-CoA:carnitine CoA-transferase CaiB-like acyl-CoA transferase